MTQPNDQSEKLKYLSRKIAQANGRKPSEAELAAALDMTVEQLRELGNKEDLVLQAAGELEASFEAVKSLLTQDPNLIGSLSPREREVIKMTLGLEDVQLHTNSQISDILQLAPDVVQRTLRRAILKLRRHG